MVALAAAGRPAAGIVTNQVVSDHRQRIAAEGVAAVANMAAAAGVNKMVVLEAGGLDVLLDCVERYYCAVRAAASEWVSSGAELCTQACRALGNLCYGWDVDRIKASIGVRGARTVAASLASSTSTGRGGHTLYRWQAHALRNLAVIIRLHDASNALPTTQKLA